jgi:hypothetical protein
MSDQPTPSTNPDPAAPAKKRRPKNRKRRARTRSFLVEDDVPPSNEDAERPDDHANLRDSLYRLRNVSGESLESEALLDHR